MHFGLKLLAHTAFLAGLKSWRMRNSRRQWRWLWVDSFFFFKYKNSPQKRWWDFKKKKQSLPPPKKITTVNHFWHPWEGEALKIDIFWFQLQMASRSISTCHPSISLRWVLKGAGFWFSCEMLGFPKSLGSSERNRLWKNEVLLSFSSKRKVEKSDIHINLEGFKIVGAKVFLMTFAYMLGTVICWSGGYRGSQRLNAKCHPVVLRGSLKRQIFVFTVSRYFYLNCGEYHGMWPLAADDDDDEEDGQDDDIDDDMRTILLLMTCCCSGWL